MQFNYLTAPANNINVNVVQQQKYNSHPYPEYLVDNSNHSISINSTTPNSTLRSVHSMKNYRCPNPPVPINYNTNYSSSSTSNSSSSTTTTVPLANNNSYSLKYHHQNRHQNHHPYNQSNINSIRHNNNNINLSNSVNSNTIANNSTSSATHHSDKANSLSLCINRINLLKKSNKQNVSQFNSMRCRKHRHRSHHFNIDSYQRYQLTKSYSNDTVNENNPVKLIQQPQTTYKFI